MREVLELLSRLVFSDLSPVNPMKGPALFRILANVTAFFLLVFGYVLGCRVLYHYLLPLWGEPYSLLAISIVLIVTSLFLFMVNWISKPKAPTSLNYVSEVEKTISHFLTPEVLKKTASMIAPKAVIAVFALATLASYLSNHKKKSL